MEVIPGIHQLRLPVPTPNSQLTDINVYLIRGEDGWLLVDTGWNTTRAFNTLEKQLKEIGIGFENISQILITHLHVDHYGLSGRLKELSKAKVSLHRVEEALIDSRYINMDNLLAEIARWLRLHGVPEEELPHLQKASLGARKFALPTPADITLKGGEKIPIGSFNFEVLWTPGHSPGHICLYEPARRLLLSGDHILPTIFPNVGLHPQSGDNPLGDYLHSLKAIEQLEVELVLPAHEHVFTNLRQRIQELYRHQEERREAILEVLQEGAKTAYEISLRIPWLINGVWVSFKELLPLDKRLAVMSTLAHLEPLRAEGKAEKTLREGIAFYNASRI
ncbi:MAG TPA: MBL fold metallo-hydrolase [Dehalococcoidia bacterium]|nr:MBL fold metallo-hydrolase [Dehalococcoidia bacterium]